MNEENIKAETDNSKVLYRGNIDNDYYKPEVIVYQDGSMTIGVGGLCIRKPIKDWHKLDKQLTEIGKRNLLNYIEREKQRQARRKVRKKEDDN